MDEIKESWNTFFDCYSETILKKTNDYDEDITAERLYQNFKSRILEEIQNEILKD